MLEIEVWRECLYNHIKIKMTTKQPSSLAEIKEKIGGEFEANLRVDCDWADFNKAGKQLPPLRDRVKSLLLSTIDQSYELGRSVGRAEIPSHIKRVIEDNTFPDGCIDMQADDLLDLLGIK